jgi:hypothetical protein
MLDNEECTHGRRRSVDVGGLALALENKGRGHGWGGWDEDDQGETRYAIFFISLDRRRSSYSILKNSYAELLSDMYNHTQTTVNHHVNDP